MKGTMGQPEHMDRNGRGGGYPSRLETDSELRQKLIDGARLGRSRLGSAESCGISYNALRTWLARGQSAPDVEPYGSFARDYMEAARQIEGRCLSVLAQRLTYLEQAPSEEVSSDDIRVVAQMLAARHPKEHGTGALREPEPEIDTDAYHREQGASQAALQAAIRQAARGESPALEQALIAEGSLLMRLLKGEEP
jgi:hypothetical protein